MDHGYSKGLFLLAFIALAFSAAMTAYGILCLTAWTVGKFVN